MPDVDANALSGVEPRGYRRGPTAADSWDQYVILARDRVESFAGRAATFRIAGAAGTTGQKLMTIFNGASSGVLVDVETITCDVYQTAAKVVEPPILRLHRTAVLPTGGAGMTKLGNDSAQTSNAQIALLQGANAEKATTAITTNPATLAVTTLITQEPVARMLTAVGYEQFDRIEFISDARPVVLRPGEGLVLNLDYTVATSNPVSDIYVGNIRWSEYTRP